MNEFNFPGSAMLSDEEINTFARGLPVPMGVSEARDYIQWTNDRNLKPEEYNNPSYINLFRAQAGAFDPRRGGNPAAAPQPGPGFVQFNEPERTTVATFTPEKNQFQKQFEQQQMQQQEMEVQKAITSARMAAFRAQQNPKSAAEMRLDTQANRLKAELNVATARLNIEGATGRAGERRAAEADLALRTAYDETRDGDTIDKLYALSRGVSMEGLVSTTEQTRGLWAITDPAMSISPVDFARGVAVLSSTPAGRAVVENLQRKLRDAEIRFATRIAETPPASSDEFLNAAKESFGPMYAIKLPEILQSIPENIRQSEAFEKARAEWGAEKIMATGKDIVLEDGKIKYIDVPKERMEELHFIPKNIRQSEAFKKARAEWGAEQIMATGKDIVLEDGKIKYIDVPKERMEELQTQATIQRVADGYETPDISTTGGRDVASKAGFITDAQRKALDELDNDQPVELELPSFTDQQNGVPRRLLAPDDIDNIAQRAYRRKLDGEDKNYRSLLMDEIKPLVDGGNIVGQDALATTLSEAEQRYRNIAQTDARSGVEAVTQGRLQEVQRIDSSLASRSKRFVDGSQSDQRLSLIAERAWDVRPTPAQLDMEAMRVVAQDLELDRNTLQTYMRLRGNPDVERIMPSVHKAFTAARSQVEKGMAKKMQDWEIEIGETIKKVQPMILSQTSQKAVDRLSYFSGVDIRNGKNLTEMQWRQIAEGDKRMGEATLVMDQKPVAIFSTPEQRQIAETFVTTSANKGQALQMLKTFFPEDPSTGIMGIDETPVGTMLESIYTGGFDRLFEAPVSQLSGAMGRASGQEIFTSKAKKSYVQARNAWSMQGAGGNDKRVFDPNKHLPDTMRSEDGPRGPWLEMYRAGAEAGNEFMMQSAYAVHLLEKDANLYQQFTDSVGELTGTLMAGGYVDDTSTGGIRSTADFDELLDAVRSSDNYHDPSVVIALDLLRSVSEKEGVISGRIENLKNGDVVYDERPAIIGESDVLRSMAASQGRTLPSNPATAIKTQLEQALAVVQERWDRKYEEYLYEINRKIGYGIF